MNRSSSQKALLVVSVIEIVISALVLIVGLFGLFAGATVGGASSAQIAEAGLTADEQAVATAGISIAAAIAVFSGIFGIVVGILGVRAAGDNQKIMPVWVLALIDLVFTVGGVIMGLVQGGFQPSMLLGVAIRALLFWVANNIKIEAGK